MLVTQTKSYPCGSVPVWKTPSKPPGRSRGERSQGSPSRDCVVEARRCYSEGMRVGLDVVRAPAPAAKHVSRSPSGFLGRLMRLTSFATRVSSAFTWRKRHLIPTDEVSRYSCPGYVPPIKTVGIINIPTLIPAFKRSSQSLDSYKFVPY